MSVDSRSRLIFVFVLGMLALRASAATPAPSSLGIFEADQDVGTLLHPGSARYDAAAQTYTISGSGENMWFGEDDFHFVWKKITDAHDLALTADVAFLGQTGNQHRKAVLMIRQTLDANSPSVDVARHGNGLTSLQYRHAVGADTHEVESNVSGPLTVRLEHRGDRFYAWVSGKDGKLQPAGAATQLPLSLPYYVGIGVCSHDKNVTETAVFSHVTLQDLPPPGTTVLYSVLETVSAASTDRRVEYLAPAHFEAPNWSRDGSSFLFNEDGKIYRLPLNGPPPVVVPTAPEDHCNNDHGISPDGGSIAISAQSERKPSLVHIRPAHRRGNAAADHAQLALVLAWLVAGRQDACLHRAARWQLRHLHDPAGRWSGDSADDRTGSGRWSRILFGWAVHLFQFRPQRTDADLAHEAGRQRPGAGLCLTRPMTGSRTFLPTENGWSSSPTTRG